VVGDDDAEHGVAQELEALVRRVAGVLGAPRSVDEGRRQPLRVDLDREAFDEGGEVGDREGDQDPSSLATT
jgi:hypothetical protein